MKKQHPYAAAGVDITAADRLVNKFAHLADATHREGRMGGIGQFAGLFDLSALPYRRPVLASATDGVGTKLLLACTQGRLEGIGQDLVAMCVNDIICSGAEPLFFLDYFACATLDAQQVQTVVSSIAQACKLAGCSLLGGETAEMPGLYRKGEFDLAGFCVGVVEADEILNKETLTASDSIIAIASSGPHSNGYTLIRKLLSEQENTPSHIVDDLLKPTTIYTPQLLPVLKQGKIRALAHITGGGLIGNLARIIPDHLSATVQINWPLPEVFSWIARSAKINTRELLEVFNGGVGMVAVLAPEHLDSVLSSLNESGLKSWQIGTITPRSGNEAVVVSE